MVVDLCDVQPKLFKLVRNIVGAETPVFLVGNKVDLLGTMTSVSITDYKTRYYVTIIVSTEPKK